MIKAKRGRISTTLVVIIILVGVSINTTAAEEYHLQTESILSNNHLVSKRESLTDVVFGVTYNTFDLGITVNDEEGEIPDEISDELNSGFGFYLGGRYKINNNFAVGFGYEQAGSSYLVDLEDEELIEIALVHSTKISGPYAEVVYLLNDNFCLNAAVAYYSAKYGMEIKVPVDDVEIVFANNIIGNELGFKVGGEYNHQINDQFAITGSAAYRIADVPIEEGKLHGEIDGEDLDEEVLDFLFGENYEIDIPEDTTLDMSGLSISLGISYSF